MCFSIFKNDISGAIFILNRKECDKIKIKSGHSHQIKVENHEKLIENIKMRGSDCDFWIFQAFSDKYGKFQSPMFCSSISRGV